MSDDIPEPDRIEGAPHPRHTPHLIGQSVAEAAFLSAFTTGRLHHGWLITGARGLGKATLAWRIARFLLAQPDDEGGLFAPPPPVSLDAPENPRITALSEPRLTLVRRPWDDKGERLRAEVTVEEVRRLKSFFTLSAADGGRRVAIIDSVDDLNTSAANALLKLLEEPPAKVTLLLISHQPASLLPTIRSRCRELRLMPLSPADLTDALAQARGEADPAQSRGAADPAESRGEVDPAQARSGIAAAQALAELAGGSVGEAFRLTNLDGLQLYAALIRLFATLPRLDRHMALTIAEAAARKGAEAQFDLTVTLLDLFLARLARAGTLHALPPEAAPGESALLERLAPTPAHARPWADLAQTLGNRARRGRSVNLDPAALLMDMVLKIDETAAALGTK